MAHKRVFDILVLAGLVLALGVIPGSASHALAAERPVTVSPGSDSKVALIGDGCPSFSWGAAEGATSYELVVYRLAEEGEEAQPVLSETFAGSASSWTPSLDRCLERGGRYAWSVRAVGGKEASEWSALSLFEVASRPSQAELDEALALVRQYFVTEGGAELKGVAEAEAQSNREASPSSPGAPAAGVVGTTQLSVDGGVVATSFTGDGSTLTDLTAANVSGTLADAQVANDITLDDITQITARGIASTTGDLDPDRLAGDTTDDDKVDAGLLGVHEHDDRYFTETETSAVGTVNTPTNPVDWTKLKGVPAGFADGTDADTDTTCDGAACDGTNFSSLQWGNLTGLPTTTKGDLLVEDGADVVRLPVGENGQVLMADSVASAGVAWAATAATTRYSIRDIGPAGGFVFYVTDGGTHGLEAAPEDQDGGTGVQWGCAGSDLAGAEGLFVGAGEQNTADIVAGCGVADIAAQIADDYALDGFENWYLPSKLEVNLMYKELYLFGMGGFADGFYWSSSEWSSSPALSAWVQPFDTSGGGQGTSSKGNSWRVRAVRGF